MNHSMSMPSRYHYSKTPPHSFCRATIRSTQVKPLRCPKTAVLAQVTDASIAKGWVGIIDCDNLSTLALVELW